MDDAFERYFMDGMKMHVSRGGIPPVGVDLAPEDIIAEYEWLTLPDGTQAFLKDGEIVSVKDDQEWL